MTVPSIKSVRRRKPTDSECLRIASVDAYAPLTEGFDIADLKEAKALLDEKY